MDFVGYGEWPSPVTSEMLVRDAVDFQEIASDGKNLYWTERVPSKKGKLQLCTFNQEDLLPEMNLRSRIHEYGGGATHAQDGVLYFVNDYDRGIYRLEAGKNPVRITPESKLRFADFSATPDGKTLYAVCEEHHEKDVVNKIVKVDMQGSVHEVAKGHDFYSSPRVSPNGKELAYLSWDHPDMPWDATSLWVEEIKTAKPKLIAGGKEESVCYPRWSKKGDLYFFSDRTGWWNLYRYHKNKIDPLAPMEAEFTSPQWVLGRGNYTFTDEDDLYCVASEESSDYLLKIFPETKKSERIDLPFTVIKGVTFLKGLLYFFGGSPTQPMALVEMNPSSHRWKIIKSSVHLSLDQEWISTPTAVAFPTRTGDLSYGFYYPPKNPKVQAKEGELPPLIVDCHGGPTGNSQPLLSLEIQYWTSRGFAFFDVNYSGSSGYGRKFRKRLEGTWGIRDVEDCVDGALFLSNQKLVDPKRMMIRGGSAGGYTTLCALCSCDLFVAGTSYYGVSDLELLTKDTHKFESHYLERLIGPYPERRDLFLKRSPLTNIDRLTKPLLLLQGDEDPIVPLNQAEVIYEKLKKKNVPVAMIVFPGEQHGFRVAKNIQRALEAEHYFYAKILKLSPPEKLAPVDIANLK